MQWQLINTCLVGFIYFNRTTIEIYMKNSQLSGFSSCLPHNTDENTFAKLLYVILQGTQKLFFLLILLLINETYSQTFTVKGNITTTDSTAVRYASVTFIDQSDTTKKYFAITDTSGNYQLNVITEIKEEAPTIPQSFELMQNYPNPFSDETNIPYKLNEESNASVTIYNILGQAVKSFKSLEQAGGMHGVTWDGRDEFGKKVSTGVYFYRLLARGETQVKKMIFTSGHQITLNIGTNRLFNETNTFIEKSRDRLSPVEFRIIITNGNNTTPQIDSLILNNVEISSDTIINFVVHYYQTTHHSFFPLQIGNRWVFQFPYWSPVYGDTVATNDDEIIATKVVDSKTYYGFNNSMPFFPHHSMVQDLIGARIDTMFVRLNEKGDLMLLVEDKEWLYLSFDSTQVDSLVRLKIKNADYYYIITAVDDTIITSVGTFYNCFCIINYYPMTKGTEHYIWAAPGYGPIKIYYPELGVTYELVKINIQNK